MSAMKKWCMAGCFAVLCLFMAGIGLRYFTAEILVKKLHMDNGLTRVVLYDQAALRDAAKPKPKSKVPAINWSKLYPFKGTKKPAAKKAPAKKPAPSTAQKLIGEIKKKTNAITAKQKAVQKEASKWTTDYLVGYKSRGFAEAYNAYKGLVHWNIAALKEYNSVVEIEDGQLASFRAKADMSEKIKNVTTLARFCQKNKAAFLYVSPPGKIMRGDEKYKTLDFSNANADEFLAGLRKNGVDTIDIRDHMEEEGLTTKDLFFRTDHHWLPEAGLWATGIIAHHLNEKGIIKSDLSLLKPDRWNKEIYENFDLGSRGKKITLARTTPDDITFYHPKFPTHLHLEIPNMAIKEDGDFDILYDKRRLDKVDYYYSSPYESYSWSNRPFKYIRNEKAMNNKTVLVIRNSFASVVLPFLSLQFKHTYELDLRSFKGSVEEVIQRKKPDVVIVLYHIEFLNKINYGGHPSIWNFR